MGGEQEENPYCFIKRLEEYKTTGVMGTALSCVSDDFEGGNDEYGIYNDDSQSGNSSLYPQ